MQTLTPEQVDALKARGLSEDDISSIAQRKGYELPTGKTAPGLGKRIGSDLYRRGQNIVSDIKQAGTRDAAAPDTFAGTFIERPANMLQTAGKVVKEVAFSTGDIAAEGLKSVGEKTGLNKPVSALVQKGLSHPKVASLIQKADQFYSSLDPDEQEALNIAFGGAGLLGSQSAVKPAQKAIVDTTKSAATKVAQDTAEFTSQRAGALKDVITGTPRTVEDLDRLIDEKFAKGVKPSAGKLKTSGQAAKFEDRARDAVKTIIENKPNLQFVDDAGVTLDKGTKLPESLADFRDAIEQTKRQVFEQYDALATQAGSKGATVDLAPVAEELGKIAGDTVFADLNPNVASYASSRADALRARGSYSATDAQKAITTLNNSLDAFYKNPTYETASRAAVDAMIVNNLRKSLDDVIEQTTEGGYQDLKNKYGSLRAIEKDVLNATLRDARRNAKGLIDYFDILSAGQVVSGVLTLNPATIATGVAQKGIQQYLKILNDPNRAIKSMFDKADRFYGTQQLP